MQMYINIIIIIIIIIKINFRNVAKFAMSSGLHL